MASIFRGQLPFRTVYRPAIGQGASAGLPNNDTFSDRGPQLQTTEGVPYLAIDSNKWNLPITSLPAETPVWQSKFPDWFPEPPDVSLMSAEARPVLPGPPHFGASFPDGFPVKDETYLYQFIAQPQVVTVYTGDQAVPIHVPDEVPINKLLTIQVEHNAGGVAVPFDVPPSLRVYHLDAAGLQVIDLAFGVCTQYGANPSYFRNWTPTAKGKFIVEVVGLFLGNVIDAVQTLTVRSNFDPFALADSNILVMRNGDVE